MKSDTEILVISGMSGAGRSTVAHSLEDLGWYVVDNLPPALVGNLIELVEKSVQKIAVVIDVRGRAFFDDLTNALADLAELGISRKILLSMRPMMLWFADLSPLADPIPCKAVEEFLTA